MSKGTYVYPQKTLSQSRSKFKMPHTLKTSFKHGYCVPFQVYEVLPGDTFKLNIASLIRMSTPIAPIMDNIVMHYAAYFVPNRLVFDNWEQLMGANKTGAWTADDNTYSVPTDILYAIGSVDYESIGFYMGCACDGDNNALPGRAYLLIWDEFYRNQNVTAPHDIDHSSANDITVSKAFSYNSKPLKLGKYADYFTKCLPEPQKHDPVSIIPGDLAVGLLSSQSSIGTALELEVGETQLTIDPDTATSGYFSITDSSEGTDLMTVTAGQAWNNINALRFAFQLQKFYEKDARYGTRYFEMLNGHFGVSNPDLVLNRPQFLGEINFRINVNQVLSTAGYSASSSTTVGAPGANSVTGNNGSLFTGSFTEHGYIIIVGGTRHEHTYSLPANRMWTRKDRLDFYDPVFANIGEQPVYLSELNSSVIAEEFGSSVFGYQEAWAEYRFIPDRVSGILNPNVSGSLDFWTLADTAKIYTGAGTATRNDFELLNDDFIYENRDSIKRALVTGDTGPDYIADIYFDLTVTREMPLFSIPGLADHH